MDVDWLGTECAMPRLFVAARAKYSFLADFSQNGDNGFLRRYEDHNNSRLSGDARWKKKMSG